MMKSRKKKQMCRENIRNVRTWLTSDRLGEAIKRRAAAHVQHFENLLKTFKGKNTWKTRMKEGNA